jgi:hypothetical protein
MYYIINTATGIYFTNFHNHPKHLRTVELLFIRFPCLVLDRGRGGWAANRSRATAGIQHHAMSLYCFLGCMLRADGGCKRGVLSGMGVMPITHDDEEDNGYGGGGGGGNCIEDANNSIIGLGKANHCHCIHHARYLPSCS